MSTLVSRVLLVIGLLAGALIWLLFVTPPRLHLVAGPEDGRAEKGTLSGTGGSSGLTSGTTTITTFVSPSTTGQCLLQSSDRSYTWGSCYTGDIR